MGVNPWGMLNNFVAALNHPFLLACLFGPLRREDVDTLEEVSHQITLGAHGQWHTHADANEVVYVQAMRTRLGPDAVFVPPYNSINQAGIHVLRDVGFRYVTTGPETT